MVWNSERRAVKADATHILASLGDTADDVAARLSAHGVVGEPRSGSDCAVAVYLNAVLGGSRSFQSLMVGTGSVRIHLQGSRLPLTVRLPRPVSVFVARFDTGNYPRLERPRTTTWKARMGAGTASPKADS